MTHDIVYILRDGKNEELRYSLRSVEKNYPHERVVFYGGRPDGIEPDLFVPYTQPGDTKWEKVRNTIEMICKNDQLTEDFILFNDDFFIMKPVETPTNYYDGTLEERIKTIEGAIFGRHSEYSDRLRHLAETLRRAGIPNPLNYAHHTPMIINRKKMLETLEKTNAVRDLEIYAETAYVHFKSDLLQTQFAYYKRDKARYNAELTAILEEERAITQKLLALSAENPYEASNHYFYNERNLLEKLLNIENLINA